jgi:3-oxoacyl-[acyl-carrier-protein] synthase-3
MTSSADFWFYSLGVAIGSEKVAAETLVEKYGPVREGFLERTGFTNLFRTPSETTSLELALQSLSAVDPDWIKANVDGIVFITSTGERSAPGNAHLLHSSLDLPAGVFVLDVNDACTGFVRGLRVATSLLHGGVASRVLLVLSDTYSKLYGEQNLKVSPLFSDGASAHLISVDRLSTKPAQAQERHWRILGSTFISEGRHADDLTISHSTDNFEFGELTMNGGGVFNFVVKHLKSSISKACEVSSIEPNTIDTWYVHQGSRAVVDAVEKTLGITDATLFRAGDYGNVVGSALPFQLWEDTAHASEAHRIGLAAFGVGLTLGVVVIDQIAIV